MRKAAHIKHKTARARYRLDKLTFGTFNVLITAVNSVTAKGCVVIGLQETKQDGTHKIVVPGYCVYFSGDCSRAKERKGQHKIGLAIKEDIVKSTGKDGIAIEFISSRLLEARISIKSNIVTFVIAYAPTEEATEIQKAKHMAAANSTAASVPDREYVCLRFHRRERQDGEERRGRQGNRQQGVGRIWPRIATKTANFCSVSQTTTRSFS